MRPIKNLIIELIALSIVCVILLVPIHYLISGRMIDFSKKDTSSMFLGSIILVGSIHLLFEISGMNESWCRKEYSM